ncbi:hypothetical protein AB0D59_03545 [Streptomyces sp. NPDC048417]|uniref:hypothetical protein n=1 Tax=Streptomyces sp. NPDC048417 TaxID=3155387 RepID=UPI003441273D
MTPTARARVSRSPRRPAGSIGCRTECWPTGPHRVLAYRGTDGFPVILPVKITGYDDTGLHLDAPCHLLPTGGRRAGFLAHAFEPHVRHVDHLAGGRLRDP